jgi:uncharacterized protein GlcG (DUF336 family)
MQAISATVDRAANDGGSHVALTVVDAAGITIAAATMDKAPARVVGIARAKAYTAAKMTVSTEAFLQKLRTENLQAGWFCDKEFSPLPGGIPILMDGACIGAVGVSGRALDDDVKLAMFFARTLEASLAR